MLQVATSLRLLFAYYALLILIFLTASKKDKKRTKSCYLVQKLNIYRKYLSERAFSKVVSRFGLFSVLYLAL